MIRTLGYVYSPADMRTRRAFIRQIAGGATLLSMGSLLSFANEGGLPVRAITRGPKYHWFGYYDKLQFDPTSRYVLGMQVDFEMRSPTKEDVIKLGYVDLQARDRWVELGSSRSWGW